MMHQTHKKTVLITGGSAGIGFEMAKRMVEKEWEVFICSRSATRLENARKKIPQLKTICCDVASETQRQAMLAEITGQCQRLDMLMNNAAIVQRYAFDTVDDLPAKLNEEWQINYLAPVLLCKMFLPLLKKSGGTIVNVTSGLVYVPLAVQANYCATKSALHSMTLSLRHELTPLGIKVQEVFYPAVDTAFQNGHAPDFAIPPGEAASVALRGLMKGKDEIRVKKSGLIYLLSRIVPGKAHRMLNRRVIRESLTRVHT